MKNNRVRSYSFLKARISNIQEEIDRLTKELNAAKENGVKRKAKEIKKALRIEQKQLKTYCKTQKSYIETKALKKEQMENEINYGNKAISKSTYLTNKKYLDRMIKRKLKNLSFEYIEEIEEQVKEDILKRIELGETISNVDIRKKMKTPFIIGLAITATVFSGYIIHSINNHPEDIYKDSLPKLDDFSILIKQINEGIKSEKSKEETTPSEVPSNEILVPETDKEIVTPTPTENEGLDNHDPVYREDELQEEQPYLTYNADQNEIHVNYIR